MGICWCVLLLFFLSWAIGLLYLMWSIVNSCCIAESGAIWGCQMNSEDDQLDSFALLASEVFSACPWSEKWLVSLKAWKTHLSEATWVLSVVGWALFSLNGPMLFPHLSMELLWSWPRGPDYVVGVSTSFDQVVLLSSKLHLQKAPGWLLPCWFVLRIAAAASSSWWWCSLESWAWVCQKVAPLRDQPSSMNSTRLTTNSQESVFSFCFSLK